MGIGRLLKSLPYEVNPADPTTLVVVMSLLFAAMVAAFVLAHWATTAEPMIALRYE